MHRNMYEIFDDFKNAETREDKINVLKQNNCYALQSVLVGGLAPYVTFCFGELPKYRVQDIPPGMSYSSLHHEIGRAYIFELGNPRVSPNLTDKRKTEILIQMLEVLETKEAEVFGNMLMKDLKVPDLTIDLVNEAFPGLIK